ncbi:hypothetical protein ACI797_20085 [Geodermatophilus sp. SYSU D00691]
MAGRRWSELDQRTRRLILLGGAVEWGLKIIALADLRRRPAAEIRGRKWIWATAVSVVGSLGAVPLAYLLVGRRRR